MTLSRWSCAGDHRDFGPPEPVHRHEIVVPLAGAFVRELEGDEAVASPATALFARPGDVYRVRHPVDGGDRGIVIQLSDDALDDLARCAGAWPGLDPRRSAAPAGRLPSDPRLPRAPAPVGPGLALRAARLAARAGAGPGAVPANVLAERPGAGPEGGPGDVPGAVVDPLLVDELLGEVLREALAPASAPPSGQARAPGASDDSSARRPAGPPGRSPAARRRHRRAVVRALEFIAAHYRDPIGLREIADAAAYSPFHFATVFRRTTGETLHAHLTRLRLRAAVPAIAAGEENLAALALRLGFSSHSHFTAAFRREYGVTPSALR